MGTTDAILGAENPQAKRRWPVVASKVALGYLALSMATLPFLGAVWLGELPVLALVQAPKTALAGWIRTDVVMRAMPGLGLSSGSFSPDYIAARPYALALAYLVPIGVLAAAAWSRLRSHPKERTWMLVLFAAAGVDYAMTLAFASGPGLTIY